MRHRIAAVLFALGLVALCPSCSRRKNPAQPERPAVAVSVPPYKYFVERLGGDLFEVISIVPAGADPHTFEPSPRQTEALMRSRVWFALGEPFERRLHKALKVQNRDILVADLREAWDRPIHRHDADDEGAGRHACCHCHLEDRHFWMSPKRAGHQAELIASTLARAFPEHKEMFERRLGLLRKDLDKLTQDLSRDLAAVENRWMLVSHPAMGYFCEDFGLHQLSLEVEGKEATPQQLAHLLEQAKQLPIGCIITQSQHNPNGAHWVAQQLGVDSEMIDPYHPDVLNNLRHIAKVFVKAQKARMASALVEPLPHTAEPACGEQAVDEAHGS
jgi:zinc transport system substrate-binding protein